MRLKMMWPLLSVILRHAGAPLLDMNNLTD